MKNNIKQFKKFINEKLLTRWGLKSKVQQITSTLGELYEFNFTSKNIDQNELNFIRKIIINHPYTVSTSPVQTKKTELEDGNFKLIVSFMVLGQEHGKQIEKIIRERCQSENETD